MGIRSHEWICVSAREAVQGALGISKMTVIKRVYMHRMDEVLFYIKDFPVKILSFIRVVLEIFPLTFYCYLE